MRPKRRPWLRSRAARAALFTFLVLAASYGALVANAIFRPFHVPVRPFPFPQPGEAVFIFAPHEDDEALGCGGLICRAMRRGVPIWICLMTMGEGEELGAAWATRRPPLSPKQFIRLGEIRRKESLQGLCAVGVPPDHVFFLGYPNMGLEPMWTARYWSPQSLWRSPYTKTDHSPFSGIWRPATPFCGAAVLQDVKAVLARVQPRYVFVTSPADTHADHRATYRFVQLALAELRHENPAGWPSRCQLFTYLVHRQGWPAPWGHFPQLRLMPPPSLAALPIMDWFSYDLSTEETTAKYRLIRSYRSQGAAFNLLMSSFARQNELFARISDIPPMHFSFWLLPDVTIEPASETRYLRLHPETDLAALEIGAPNTHIPILLRTVQPLRRQTRIDILLTAVSPTNGQLRALSVGLQGQSLMEAWGATDKRGLLPLEDAVRLATEEPNTITLFVPGHYAGPTGTFLVDVLIHSGRKIVDYALTRTVVGSPPRSP